MRECVVVNIALAQTEIIWEDKKKNYDKLRQIVLDQKANDVDYIFFPEMTLTGFSMNTGKTSEDNRYTVETLSNLARDNGIGIGFGWVQRVGEKCKNCYSIVNKDGQIISEYVKIHPFSYSGEDKFFVGGNEIKICSLDGIKTATLICYDLRFPEVFRLICDQVDAVIIPANWPKKRAEHWKALLKARAIENQIYVLAINCVGNIGGLEYSGDSCIINPNGDVVESISCVEGIIKYEFKNDVALYRDSFPVLNDIKDADTIEVCDNLDKHSGF